ncbi:MAG: response regulator transcription factor [Treponema sp.]|jgi:DNA-binding response OmpR family regulator|nr:response regulator transcription factor [Treponema sp.]
MEFQSKDNRNRGVILLAEGDEDSSGKTRRLLELQHYVVHTTFTLSRTLKCLNRTHPDIILLDTDFPDGDGFNFCKEIRGKTQAHILFFTARAEHEEKIKGLSVGADDYITIPFHTEELLARLKAIMRRREIGIPLRTIKKGHLVIDLVSDRVFASGKDLQLSQKEFSTLCLLAQNEGKLLSAEYVYERVWGQPMGNTKNAIQMVISRLRNKIALADYSIYTIHGKGYIYKKQRRVRNSMIKS